jgi:hypothetical protein
VSEDAIAIALNLNSYYISEREREKKCGVRQNSNIIEFEKKQQPKKFVGVVLLFF